MSREQTIRSQVSEDYARAVNSSGPESCCCSATEQKGVASRLGGYETDELAALPDDAVVNSFGCGNPVAFSGVEAGQTVIDLGSGAGIDLLLAANRVGAEGYVIGVDMTDVMIERAKANIAAAGLSNVEVRKGIIEALPVDDSSADWVISNCVINLSPEKPKVFAEIARVLKTGGRIAISDIVVESLPEAIRVDRNLYSGCVSGAISEKEYIAGLEAAGLTDVEVVDRIVYTTEQLLAFVDPEKLGETPADEGACGCGGVCPGLTREQAQELAAEMTGQVWSAAFRATRG